jgi:hypothetical protein
MKAMRTITFEGRPVPELQVSDLLADGWNTLRPYRDDVRVAATLRTPDEQGDEDLRKQRESSLRAVEERIAEAMALLSDQGRCEQIGAELLKLIDRLWADARNDEARRVQRRWVETFVEVLQGSSVHTRLAGAVRRVPAAQGRRPRHAKQ